MRDPIIELRRLSNQPAAPEEIPFGSWLNRWIDNYAEHGCQPKTLGRYRQLDTYITGAKAGETAAVAKIPIRKSEARSTRERAPWPITQKAVRGAHISARIVRHVGGLIQGEAFRLDLIPVNPMPSSLRQLVEFSRTGFRTCAVFLMQDRDPQSVHRLYGSNTAQLIPPDQAQRDAGNANSAGELTLVIELVRPNTKHLRDSTTPAHVDGAGGSPTD